MISLSSSRSRPAVLSASTEMQAYGLFAFAMALTLLGVFGGMVFAKTLFSSGMHLFLLFAELGLILTAGWWSRSQPLNYFLFALFPLFSGITITPYLLLVLAGFANGPAILFNAVLATVFLSLAAAILARIAPNLAVFGRTLFLGLIGVLILGIVQIFVPVLRTGPFELLLSGAGIVLFGAFTAFDLQRIAAMGKTGANPFLLALSLYLDIFNLFLMVLRFMTALSGNRR